MFRKLFGGSSDNCPTHDQPSHQRTAALEEELGVEPKTPAPDSLTETYANPDLVECRRGCKRKR